MKRIYCKQKIPKSKKQRILNKYIPKGTYCHIGLHDCCPYYETRLATDKELLKIYDKSKIYFDKLGLDKKSAIAYMKNGKEKNLFMFVNVCKRIHYNEYCQESLLWDQVKECGLNEGNFYESYYLKIPNKIRRRGQNARNKYVKERGYY